MEDGEDGVVVLFFNINCTFFCVCRKIAVPLRHESEMGHIVIHCCSCQSAADGLFAAGSSGSAGGGSGGG